jgi:hypothetical protein
MARGMTSGEQGVNCRGEEDSVSLPNYRSKRVLYKGGGCEIGSWKEDRHHHEVAVGSSMGTAPPPRASSGEEERRGCRTGRLQENLPPSHPMLL